MPEFPNVSIPSYEDLLFSVPEQYRTEEVQRQLQEAYDRELDVITDHVKMLIKQGKPFRARMMIFDFDQREGAYQSRADFTVSDLSKPEKDMFNWYGQNTSRWAYAGCIAIDLRAMDNGGRVITTHH